MKIILSTSEYYAEYIVSSDRYDQGMSIVMMSLHYMCCILTSRGKNDTHQECAWGETCVNSVLILISHHFIP